MILMKIVPFVPGHFSEYEWLALGIWLRWELLWPPEQALHS